MIEDPEEVGVVALQKDENIINQILQRNKKILVFGEIDHLFQSLKSSKPQFKVSSYLSSEFRPQKVPSFISKKSAQINNVASGTIIYLRVFDDKENRSKCLKIFFLEHFVSSFFVNEINALYQTSKTLMRSDLILQVYETYIIGGNNNGKAYFIIEYEDFESSLSKLYGHLRPNSFPESLKQIMETALNYTTNSSSIKEKPIATKKLVFPLEYLKYFFMVKDGNGQSQVKLNVLSYELFQSPLSGELFRDSRSVSQTSSKKKQDKQKRESQVNELNNRLGRLLLNVQCLNTIKNKDLIDTLEKNFPQLLEIHDKEIFEIIAQHPKYNEFELGEYGPEFFILGTNISGKQYNLKCEKFNSLKEVQETIQLYEQYYSQDNNMLIPVTSFDPILLEKGQYVLIEELVIPKENQFQKNKQPVNLTSSYMSVQQLLSKKSDLIQDKLRCIQVAVQLIKFVQFLHQNNFSHGNIDYANTMINIPNVYSSKLPAVFFSNPLFLRNKEFMKQRKEYKNDYEQLDDIAFMLLFQDDNDVIDKVARNKFMDVLFKYFEDLKEGRILRENNKDQMKNMMENEENDVNFYLKKLNDVFLIFEGIYKNNMPDKYIKINKKWQITLKKRKDVPHICNHHHYDDDSDIYDDDDDDEGGFFFDDDDDSDEEGYWYVDSDDVDDEMVGMNQRLNLLDQCNVPEMFQLQIEEVAYNFKYRVDYNNIEILKAIATNKNLLSINFKNFNSSLLRNIKGKDKEHSIDYINRIHKNCENLQTIKLEIIQEDTRQLDVKNLFELQDLQNIKFIILSSWDIDQFKSEQQFFDVLQYYQDLVQLFQLNKRFKSIRVYPYNSFISGFQFCSLEWYQKSMNKTYEIFMENIAKIDSNKRQKNLKATNNFSSLTNINSAKITEKIRNKLNEKLTFENKLEAFFKAQKIRNTNFRKQAQSELMLHIKAIEQKKLFININLKQDEENKNQIIIEFENSLDEDMGLFQVKLEYRNQVGFILISTHCKYDERYKCQQFQNYGGFDPIFNQRTIDKWILSDYETKVKKNIFGEHYSSVCRHCDSLQLQRFFYTGQKDLRKLSLYVEFCENFNNLLTKNRDFFELSKIPSRNLAEIKLSIRLFDFRNGKKYYKNLRHQLENAKTLSQITINLDSNFFDVTIKRQFMKIKRLVTIRFKDS